MRRYTWLEISVGLFVIAGAGAVAYLSLTLGGLRLGRDQRYTLSAQFASASDLKVGDPVKLAGVTVGEVSKIALVDFAARVELALDKGVKLPTDTIASIKTAGLLGDAYLSLSPGAALSDLSGGGRITRTEPAISITDLIAKYAFGSPLSDKAGEADKPAPAQSPSKEPKKAPFSDPLE
jgi:phospholipid/cholesterol/gamma-HCH transport system substrate-binding protein